MEDDVKKLKLGEKIRELRLKRGNTLKYIAEITGLSVPLLSQVENNSVSPPVATLLRIAKALEVGISHFFREEESKGRAIVVRKNERKKAFRSTHTHRQEAGYSYEALAYTKNSKHMEPFLVEFEPRNKEKVSFLKHRGEEFVFVFRGRLAFQYEHEEIILNPGDSLYFESGVPHGFRALRGGRAQAIVVVFPEE